MGTVSQSYNKRAGWKRLYDWDFSRFTEFKDSPAETSIASATYVVTGNLDNLIVLNSQAINNYRVQLLISGGTPGCTYTITVTAVTFPTGYILSWDGILMVIP